MRLVAVMGGLILALVGCRQEQVRSYSIPKEKALASASPTSPHAEMGLPRIRFETPEGWEERPASGMRAAAFQIPNPNGPSAEVSVIPMDGVASSQEDIVNIWRNQAGLAPLDQGGLGQQSQPVPIGNKQGDLFQLAGKELSIEVAVLHEANTSWFFKMTGPPHLIESQQAAFRQFLASVQFQSGMANAHDTVSSNSGLPPSGGSGGLERPHWDAPSGWRETPPSVMALARFVLGDGDKAEVTVTPLGGMAGGVLDNVNRWRGQLGLGPIAQNDLDQAVQPLDEAGAGAILVEMTGKEVRGGGAPATIVAAIIPRSEQTWFYKLKGDPAVVNEARQDFIGFVRSVEYPNDI